MNNLSFSLADITYEQGLQLLSLRKQALDSGKLPRMPKAAYASAAPLQAIGAAIRVKAANAPFWANENLIRNAALLGVAGTGVGAAAGLGYAELTDKNYKRRALQGGLAGGLLGGGLGYLNTSAAPGKPLVPLSPDLQAKANAINTLPEVQRRAAVKELNALGVGSAPTGILLGGIGAGGLAATTVGNWRFTDPKLLAKYIREHGADSKTNHRVLDSISRDGTGFKPAKPGLGTAAIAAEQAAIVKNLKIPFTFFGKPHQNLLSDIQAALPTAAGELELKDLSRRLTSKRFGVGKWSALGAAATIPAALASWLANNASGEKAEAKVLLPHLLAPGP